MLVGVCTGRIPSYYREVYSQLSGTEGGRVSRRTWQSLADTATLPSSVLDQVIYLYYVYATIEYVNNRFGALAIVARNHLDKMEYLSH